jgi:hypothetical protein
VVYGQWATRPFFEEQAEGENWNEPAVGVLFVGGPHVTELAAKVEPEDGEGGQGEDN